MSIMGQLGLCIGFMGGWWMTLHDLREGRQPWRTLMLALGLLVLAVILKHFGH